MQDPLNKIILLETITTTSRKKTRTQVCRNLETKKSIKFHRNLRNHKTTPQKIVKLSVNFDRGSFFLKKQMFLF